MIFDESYGVIPLKKVEQKWQVYLIQHKNGNHWGFPKGHANLSETPQKAALRELKEETNLQFVKFLQQDPLIEQYQFTKDNQLVSKKVFYFLMEVEGEVKLQIEEILQGKWLNITEAKDQMTFQEGKNLITQLEVLLKRF